MMKDFVLVDLYTDGNDAASQANQALEDGEFHTIAIPFYAIYDPNKKVVATFPSLTRGMRTFSPPSRALPHRQPAAS